MLLTMLLNTSREILLITLRIITTSNVILGNNKGFKHIYVLIYT